MKRFTLAILAVLVLCAPSSAQEELNVAKQFVNATTIVFARVDTKQLKLPETLSKVLGNSQLATPFNELQSLSKAMGSDTIYIVVDVPFSSASVPVRLIAKKSSGLDLAALKEKLGKLSFSEPSIEGDYLCVAPLGSTIDSNKVAIQDGTLSVSRPELMAAFQSVKNLPVQIAIDPPEYLWSTFRDLMPTLPAKLGGGPSSILTEGLQWASIGFDPASLRIESIVQGKTNESASALADRLPNLLTSIVGELPLPKAKETLQALLKLTRTEVKGSQITIASNGLPNAIPLLASTFDGLLAPMAAQVKSNRLKQLALSIHNYESAFRVLPPAKEGRNAEGRYQLSWRVHILPFIDEGELYSKFHLQEPWDSEHNIKLLDKMPNIFSSYTSKLTDPKEMKPGHTVFLAPIGDDTLFGGQKPIKFSEVSDGLSNTIMILEVKPERSVPWTSPDDYVFDVTKPADGLALDASGNFFAVLGDGSVQTLSGSLPAKTLVHLFQKSDGNAIKW